MHHDVLLFLIALAVLLGAARLLGEVLGRFGFPAVVGEILAGIVIGKTLLGRVAPSAYQWLFPPGNSQVLLTGYTTVGAVLLLVMAGLEVDLSSLRRSSRAAVLTSAFGAVIPFVLGYASGMLLPDHDLADPARRGVHAAFLGIALSISALPVIAKTLIDLRLIKTDLGLIILSAAVFDDLAGWTGFSILSREFVRSGETSLRQIGISVALTLAFVIVTLLVVRPLVDRWLSRAVMRKEASNGRVLSFMMVLALLGAAVTEALGMHAVFGGFVMGLAIGDSKRLREHTRNVLEEFVTSVFTPVFFATMALRFDFVAAFDLRLVALVLAIACVAKVGGCTLGAWLGGFRTREAFTIGFGMNSRGAMEILLAVLAMEAKIINARIFVALVVMAVVTSLVSGPAMARLLRITRSPALKLLRTSPVVLDLEAGTREAALRELARVLAEHLHRPGDAARFGEAVIAREELAGTGVGEGVAIPHAEVDGLAAPAVVLCRSARALDFDAPDGGGVRLIFMLLIPPREFSRELELLAAIARLVASEEVRNDLLAAKDTRTLFAVLEQADRKSLDAAGQPKKSAAPSRN